ncbi:TPA: terminase large subunit [Vibrio cholerae]
MSKYPAYDQAERFAKQIIAGKIPSCKYVKLACQRHFDDLESSKKKDYPYKFDKAEAQRRIDFIELLPHTKGDWAFKRQLLTLEPWQKFGIAMTFGWKRKSDGMRRFRESYWEVNRKNGKSAIAAGIGLSCFVQDREFGAEVYSGATTEKQAWEVFRPARLMVKRTPLLAEAAGIEVNASNMNRPSDGARFEPVIGNPGDGASPSCALIDEYHEHDSDNLYATMLTGMGARKQPLMLIITTAGANIEGPCYDKRREVVQMLEGIIPSDELFGWIWTIDEDDDWKDPAVLAKANPNMGVSVYKEYLISQQQRAIKQPRFTNRFKTKHLGIWVTAKTGFFNLAQWEKLADPTLTLEHFEGQPCILSFDLARKLDMNSMSRIFWRDIEGKRHYYSVAPKFWVPEETVFNGDNQKLADMYQKWVNQGLMYATDGAEVDYREILEEAKEASRINPVLSSPIDPFGATNLGHQLDDEGLEPITIVQNYTNMSDPMKEIEAAIASGRFHHDGNPIMTWCMSNVIGKYLPGNDDVVRPIKQGNDNKIDGAVTLIMGVGRIMVPAGDSDEDFMNAIMDPIF